MNYFEFLEKNEYSKKYIDLIKKANLRILENCYYEEHHIKPKCIGGSDEPDNLVKLTAKEHFIAHKLLTEAVKKEYKGSICAAFILMCNRIKDKFNFVTPELYEKAQRETVKYLSKKLKGKSCPWRGKNFQRIGLKRFVKTINVGIEVKKIVIVTKQSKKCGNLQKKE